MLFRLFDNFLLFSIGSLFCLRFLRLHFWGGYQMKIVCKRKWNETFYVCLPGRRGKAGRVGRTDDIVSPFLFTFPLLSTESCFVVSCHYYFFFVSLIRALLPPFPCNTTNPTPFQFSQFLLIIIRFEMKRQTCCKVIKMHVGNHRKSFRFWNN